MSGQNSWISVGVGVVLAAATWYIGGAAGWSYLGAATLAAVTIGMTATSLILGPDAQQGQPTQKPDKLEISASEEATTIPVVFGTTRCPGNFIRVGYDKFKATPIKQKGEGKGAKSTVVGYTYTFPLSYGICMGQIDRLMKVVASPGMKKMTTFGDSGLSLIDSRETFEIIQRKKQGDQTAIEGGSCYFYPGSRSPGDGSTTTDTCHRDVCWVDFPKYRIDGSTVPRSLLFEVRRIPKVLKDDGTAVPDFPKRAANNPSHTEYDDANPAAVAYEVLKNELWGKGLQEAKIDVDSFRDAAKYYQTHRIGISTAMTRNTLAAFMQRLRDIFGLWVWWDGEKMRAQCIYDTQSKYRNITTITADDMLEPPTITRPGPNASFNELRLTFTNRNNNYQSEVATAMDLAHAETVGGIRSQTIDAGEVGTRKTAERLAQMLLRRVAYPPATCSLKLRRTYSALQPAGFVALEIDEWRPAGVATTYWRVVDVEDNDQSADGIVLNLMEDIHATARDGMLEDGQWVTPDGIDEDDALSDADLSLGDIVTEPDPGTITPIGVWSPNIYISGAARVIAVLPSRENAFVQSVDVAWSTVGSSITNDLGPSSTMPISGKLLTSIPSTGPKLSRATAGEFQIELDHDADAITLEAATGLVQTDSDDFSLLTATNQALLLINGEIFRIGFAEETSPGVITVRTYMRAELATERAAHAIDDRAYFIEDIADITWLKADAIPSASLTNLHVIPTTASGIDGDLVMVPDDSSGQIIGMESLAPFAPELVEATRVGTTWTIRIRPRMWATGSGTRPDLEDDLNSLVGDISALSLRFQRSDNATLVTVPSGTSYSTPPFSMPSGMAVASLSWHTDDGTADGGIITVTVTFSTNPPALQIFGVRAGVPSATFLEIPQPT